MLYDSESNIISIELAKGEIDHAREFGNFIIHLSPAGKPILIEILNASKFVGQIENLKKPKEIKELIATS